MKFFKTTWIPDETFFQTLVGHFIPSKEIRTRTLTFLVFSDYGMPAKFYNDHYEFLIRQDSLFARKISAGATALRQRLGALYNSKPRMREKIYINLSRNVGAQDYGSRRVFGN